MVFKAYANEQRDLRWVVVALSSIATLLLAARLLTTWKNRGWFGLEDVFVVMADVSLIVFASCVYTATTYGFGTHLNDLLKNGGNLPKAMMFFWLTQFFYIMTNMFNKLAFLTLYYRIFAIKPFRRACLVLIGLSVMWGVGFGAAGLFQCTPVRRTWNIKTVPGHCINTHWQRWTNAVSNLLTDFAIFILPMPVISRLNMSSGNKIGLVFLFSIGFLICLITVLRMATLPQTLKTTEPTWESAPTNLWSFIEAAVGVICACLISLRKTISAWWPDSLKSSKGTSARPYQYHSGSALSGRKKTKEALDSYAMDTLKMNGLGETHVSVHTKDMGVGVSRSSSQERMINGITVTQDVVVSSERQGN